eukprot:CAMPEP_0113432492 /NCGR_PEP_ID=MMETSP0013_2-20120614/34223_1 /TAXON_ID=2843 ORGANISM="Skeletonema costatum, Strain 1716" /NCGR_SAMPLE_ID=MMETSP0013_2 /ASSEMBLY_ACC=CAM_ASM_000158 /LENGTH=33 /DNA_ID=CAMNT_0000321707 /DNA_START=123 /DNA_END=220 /DNA_ORIENTATION=+ /assembly_acc=CAM_ASM_000158
MDHRVATEQKENPKWDDWTEEFSLPLNLVNELA